MGIEKGIEMDKNLIVCWLRELKDYPDPEINLGSIADRIESEYVELPKDADGKPCKIGGLMQDASKTGFAEKPVKIIGVGGKNVFYRASDGLIKAHAAANMHHVEPPKPLTKEDIDAKAKIEGAIDYWDCHGIPCVNCQSRIEGRIPREYYKVSSCKDAMVQDILRLERERVAGEI